MIFNEHSNLKGKHAFLSPSNHHRMHYADDDILEKYAASKASEIGTAIHSLACDLISRRQLIGVSDRHLIQYELSKAGINLKLIDTNDILATLVPYVKDCIGFRMQTEQVLYYSKYAFGTTDAIMFDSGVLRISDLKTGRIPADMEQLEDYAALFCLEYNKQPKDISIELKLYQSATTFVHNPDAQTIEQRAKDIIRCSKILTDYFG